MTEEDGGSEVADEAEIAEEEVILDTDEAMELAKEEAADDVGDDDDGEEEEALPAGGSLSSATRLSLFPNLPGTNNLQFPSQGEIINVHINIFRVLLHIPTILIGDLQRMFSI